MLTVVVDVDVGVVEDVVLKLEVAVLVLVVVSVVVGEVISHPAKEPSTYDDRAAFNTSTLAIAAARVLSFNAPVRLHWTASVTVPREYSFTILLIAMVVAKQFEKSAALNTVTPARLAHTIVTWDERHAALTLVSNSACVAHEIPSSGAK